MEKRRPLTVCFPKKAKISTSATPPNNSGCSCCSSSRTPRWCCVSEAGLRSCWQAAGPRLRAAFLQEEQPQPIPVASQMFSLGWSEGLLEKRLQMLFILPDARPEGYLLHCFCSPPVRSDPPTCMARWAQIPNTVFRTAVINLKGP